MDDVGYYDVEVNVEISKKKLKQLSPQKKR